jgi:hypothetical protein
MRYRIPERGKTGAGWSTIASLDVYIICLVKTAEKLMMAGCAGTTVASAAAALPRGGCPGIGMRKTFRNLAARVTALALFAFNGGVGIFDAAQRVKLGAATLTSIFVNRHIGFSAQIVHLLTGQVNFGKLAEKKFKNPL